MSSCIDNTYKPVSASWGSAFEDVIGFAFRRTVEFTETMPADRMTPLLAVNKVSHEADVKFTGLATPRAVTARNDLVVVVKKMGIAGGTKTITMANSRVSGLNMDGNTQPHSQEESFRNDPQATEDLAPISVA